MSSPRRTRASSRKSTSGAVDANPVRRARSPARRRKTIANDDSEVAHDFHESFDSLVGNTGTSDASVANSTSATSLVGSTMFSSLSRLLTWTSADGDATSAATTGSSASQDKALEKQTLALSQEGSIWNAVARPDAALVMSLVKKDPSILESRGPVGETPLHLLFLMNTPAHLCLAKQLMLAYPNAAPHCYIGTDDCALYTGENCMHIAIVNQDFESVKWLAERFSSMLLDIANGTFFQEGSACYYGETALFFAACTNQTQIFDYLCTKVPLGLNSVDSNKNNLAHLMVIHELPGMLDHILEKHKKMFPNDNLLDQHNKAGFTPLQLAAHRNDKTMFQKVLVLTSKVLWTYGPVKCSVFPLNELDFIPGERKGALEILVDDQHFDILDLKHVKSLLDKKWESFARDMFRRRFYLFVGFAFSLLASIIMNPVDDPLMDPISAIKEQRYFEVVTRYSTVVYCFVWISFKLVRELREMWAESFRGYFSQRGSAFLENTASLSLVVSAVITVVLRCLGNPYSDFSLTIATVSTWLYMLWFALGFRLTGPFIIMLKEMLLNDFRKFCIILTLFMAGFGQVFFVLLDQSNSSFVTYLNRIQNVFLTIFGEISFGSYEVSTFPVLSVSCLILYLIIVTILLLNLLIAMMGDTYQRINEQADKQWLLERTRIIFSMENELSDRERREMGDNQAHKYWMELPDQPGERFLQIEEVNKDHYSKMHECGEHTGDHDDGHDHDHDH